MRSTRSIVPPLALVVAACVCTASAGESYPPKIRAGHPQVILPNGTDGGTLALSDYRGKKILLVHFGTWSRRCREELPAWNEVCAPLVTEGKLAVVGVAQEQSADRARLFMQWRQIEWPLMHDAPDLMGVSRLPCVVAVDEHGVVQLVDPEPDSIVARFVSKTFKKPKDPVPYTTDQLPEPKVVQRAAAETNNPEEYGRHGILTIFSGNPLYLDGGIESLRTSIKLDANQPSTHYALGVAFLMRAAGERAQAGDVSKAVESLRRAVELSPKHEVYKARLQQMTGSRKAVSGLYGWIAQARKEIAARGDEPVRLAKLPEARKPAKR